jgi:hypothetical protein
MLYLNNTNGGSNTASLINFRTGTGDGLVGFVAGSTNECDFVVATDGGSNGIERLRVNNAGIVTKPYQPAWRLQPDTASNVTDTGVLGWSATAGSNRFINGVTLSGSSNADVMTNGGNTGRLNVPVAGKYQIDVTLRQESTTTSGNIYLYINGALTHRMHVEAWGLHPYTHGRVSSVLNLAANDYIEIKYTTTSAASMAGTNDTVNWFSGHLIG